MTESVENFVKVIYKNKYHKGRDTKPGTIAKVLGITNPAATDMAKKLADKNLIAYKKYKALGLTDEGEQLALKVLRKHRLWETFLQRVFNLSLYDIHREAEMLEHQTSDFLAEKLSDYLGDPRFDPHGDPIPNNKGEIKTDAKLIQLSNAEERKYYVISCLMSDDKAFFDFCAQNGIKYGNSIWISKQFPSSGMTQISVNNNIIVLNKDLTDNIFVTLKSN